MSRHMTFFNWCCVFTLLASTGFVEAVSRKPVVGKKGMAVAVEPIATKIAVDIMKKGGNAIDAAVELRFAMAVTSPSNANIGGGGFMVIRLADGSAIKAKGHIIRTSGFFSGSYRQGDGHCIMVDPKTGYLMGAPDPRIEGAAFGY